MNHNQDTLKAYEMVKSDEQDKRVQRKRALVLLLVYMLTVFGPVVAFYKYRVPLVDKAANGPDYSQNIFMNR